MKARPFKTRIGDVKVEGFFEGEIFVFRFYGLITFRPDVIRLEEDAQGKFAVLQDAKIYQPDGFVLTVATEYDSDLGCEWGYQVSIKRDDTEERKVAHDRLRKKGVDPDSVIWITPPKQLTAVYFNPDGVINGSSQLEPVEGHNSSDLKTFRILNRVQLAAAQRILFLSHAVRQISRPDRMITTDEIRKVIATGVIIEAYPNDPRGPSCLILGRGLSNRPIHVVCSPKPDFLAIITAYLPNHDDWSEDFRVRAKP